MKKKGHITAFYIETLVMITVVIGILLVLSQIMGLSRKQSIRAKRLTEAVTIAQSMAEASVGCGDLASFPLELGEASLGEEAEGKVVLSGTYLWSDEGEGTTLYRVQVLRTRMDAMAEDEISVFPAEGEEPIYTLHVRHREGET